MCGGFQKIFEDNSAEIWTSSRGEDEQIYWLIFETGGHLRRNQDDPRIPWIGTLITNQPTLTWIIAVKAYPNLPKVRQVAVCRSADGNPPWIVPLTSMAVTMVATSWIDQLARAPEMHLCPSRAAACPANAASFRSKTRLLLGKRTNWLTRGCKRSNYSPRTLTK